MKSKLIILIFLTASFLFAEKIVTKTNRLQSLKGPLIVGGFGGNSVTVTVDFRDANKKEIVLFEDIRRDSKTKGELFLDSEELMAGKNNLNLYELKSLENHLKTWLKQSVQLNDVTTVSVVKGHLENIKNLIKQKEKK